MDGADYTYKSAKEPERESFGTKAIREAYLTGIALAAIPNAVADSFTERPVETTVTALSAAALSFGLHNLSSRAGPLRTIAQSIGIGLGVSAFANINRAFTPTIRAFSDNWQSADNWSGNVDTVRNQFAPFLADTIITSGAAVGAGFGAKSLRSALSVPLVEKPTLPALTSKGFLPPGIHATTWAEFATAYGTTPRRAALLQNMEFLLQEARRSGHPSKMYVGGSFVTNKPNPTDFDLTWKISGKEFGKLQETHPLVTNREHQRLHLGGELMSTYPNSPDGGVLRFLMENRKYGTAAGVVELDLSTLPSPTNYTLRKWLGHTKVTPLWEIDGKKP